MFWGGGILSSRGFRLAVCFGGGGGILSSQGFRLAVCFGEGGSCLAGVFVLLCVWGRGDLV